MLQDLVLIHTDHCVIKEYKLDDSITEVPDGSVMALTNEGTLVYPTKNKLKQCLVCVFKKQLKLRWPVSIYDDFDEPNNVYECIFGTPVVCISRDMIEIDNLSVGDRLEVKINGKYELSNNNNDNSIAVVSSFADDFVELHFTLF